jgi:arylamine N-acetyltransferase
LRNNQLTIHHTGGVSETRVLTSVAELREVLDTIFGITVPSAVDSAPNGHSALQTLIG